MYVDTIDIATGTELQHSKHAMSKLRIDLAKDIQLAHVLFFTL